MASHGLLSSLFKLHTLHIKRTNKRLKKVIYFDLFIKQSDITTGAMIPIPQLYFSTLFTSATLAFLFRLEWYHTATAAPGKRFTALRGLIIIVFVKECFARSCIRYLIASVRTLFTGDAVAITGQLGQSEQEKK